MMKNKFVIVILLSLICASCKLTNTDSQVKYTVSHMLQNLDDDGYTEIESETKSGYAGEKTKAEEKSYEGFTVLNYEQQIIENETTIVIKYDRNLITFSLNLSDGKEPQKITKKYGTSVNSQTVPDPESDGAVFSNWTPALPETFTENAAYIASWNYYTYTVKYLFENINDSGYSSLDAYPDVTAYGKKGESTKVLAPAVTGFEAQPVNQVLLSDTENIVTVYYKRSRITYFIELNGGTGLSSVTGKYGETFTNELLGTYSKQGFTFSGLSKELPETFELSKNNTTIASVLWTAQGSARYAVRFYLQNKTGPDYTEDKTLRILAVGVPGELTDITVNDGGEVVVGTDKVTKTGFHVITDAENKPLISNEEIAGNETTIVKVYLDRNITKVIFKNPNVNGTMAGTINGECASFEMSGRYDSLFTYPDSVRTGYKLIKWTDDATNAIPVTKFPSEGEMNLTSGWEPVKYSVEINKNSDYAERGSYLGALENKVYDSSVFELKSDFYKRTGYTLVGYSKNENASPDEAEYKAGVNVKNLTTQDGETVVLYAVWKPYTLVVPQIKSPSIDQVYISFNIKATLSNSSESYYTGKIHIYVNDELVKNGEENYFETKGEQTSGYYTVKCEYHRKKSTRYTMKVCAVDNEGREGEFTEMDVSLISTALLPSFAGDPPIGYTNRIVWEIEFSEGNMVEYTAKLSYRKGFYGYPTQIQEKTVNCIGQTSAIIEFTDVPELNYYHYYLEVILKDELGQTSTYSYDTVRYVQTITDDTSKPYGGQIYYSDGTTSFDYIEGKTPVGIYVEELECNYNDYTYTPNGNSFIIGVKNIVCDTSNKADKAASYKGFNSNSYTWTLISTKQFQKGLARCWRRCDASIYKLKQAGYDCDYMPSRFYLLSDNDKYGCFGETSSASQCGFETSSWSDCYALPVSVLTTK